MCRFSYRRSQGERLMKLKTIDLCAGIGGIRRGFELAGDYTRHHIRHFLSVRSYYKGIDYCTARMSSIICTPAVLQLREFS